MKTKKIVNIALYVAAGYGVYYLYKKMSSKKSSFSGYSNASGCGYNNAEGGRITTRGGVPRSPVGDGDGRMGGGPYRPWDPIFAQDTRTVNPNMEGLPGMTGRSLSPSELAARKERGARAMEEYGGPENFFRLPKPTQEEVAKKGAWCLCDWIGCATDYCCMSTCCEYCPSQGPSMIDEG